MNATRPSGRGARPGTARPWGSFARDVLTGDVSEERQLEILKQSVTTLATQLLGRNILNTPHARAAMLGFELGKAFGDAIAEDLGVILKTALKRECLTALAEAQAHGPALPQDIDYGRDPPTRAFVPKKTARGSPTEFTGYTCAIVPESVPEGGGFKPLVEATSPVERSWWRWSGVTGGQTIYFDPGFAGWPRP